MSRYVAVQPDHVLDLELVLPLNLMHLAHIWSPREYDIQWSLERHLHDAYSGSTIMREHTISRGFRPDFTVRSRVLGREYLGIIETKWLADDSSVRQLRAYLAVARSGGMADSVFGVLVATDFFLTARPTDVDLVVVRPSFVYPTGASCQL